MAYISHGNLFLQATRYGHTSTSKDWNVIDKILPYSLTKANVTDDGLTHSDWMTEADEQVGV